MDGTPTACCMRSALGISEPPGDPDGAPDDTDFVGEAFVAVVLGVGGLEPHPGRIGVRHMLDPLRDQSHTVEYAVRPCPGQDSLPRVLRTRSREGRAANRGCARRGPRVRIRRIAWYARAKPRRTLGWALRSVGESTVPPSLWIPRPRDTQPDGASSRCSACSGGTLGGRRKLRDRALPTARSPQRGYQGLR